MVICYLVVKLDDPKNDHQLENEFHMKDEHLALKNVDKLEDIYNF